tara:strand:- start:7892 stop:8518 length:627 start_codon:yes stop_codon:yes gene_type:complete
MSCKGIGKAFGEIADKIDQLQDQIDLAVDTTVDAIASELGINFLKAKFLAMQGEFEALFQEEFGNLENFLKQLRDGIPFADELGDLVALAAQTERFIAKAKEIEEKYGDKNNTINNIMRDPVGFFDSLGSDLESLCEAMPNFEKAKNGKIKVTSAKFNLDAGEIDAEELINEGVSPTIERLKDFLKNLRLEVVQKESKVDKDTKNAFA